MIIWGGGPIGRVDATKSSKDPRADSILNQVLPHLSEAPSIENFQLLK